MPVTRICNRYKATGAGAGYDPGAEAGYGAGAGAGYGPGSEAGYGTGVGARYGPHLYKWHISDFE